MQTFVADNREALGTTSDKLAWVTQALADSLDDIKQILHVAPNTLQNFVNIYQPAQGAVSGVLDGQQLRQPDLLPVRRDSGGVAAGRRAVGEAVRAVPGADHQEPPVQLPARSAQNLFVGATARPNEITYSEDWMRPDYVPPQDQPAGRAARRRPMPRRHAAAAPRRPRRSAAPTPRRVTTEPGRRSPGMMVPPGGGS